MIETIFDKIAQQLQNKIYLGASLALYKNDSWETHYFGTIDGQKATVSNLSYDIASVSKVVGTGTMLLFALKEKGLDLDKPLKTYYPDFHSQDVSLRQLLTHTSGLDPFIPNRDQLKQSDLIVAMNQLTITSNKSFRYTDVNFVLLGFLLETLYHQSLDHLFDERIFKPWKMKNTGFAPKTPAVPTAKGHPLGIVHDPKAQVLQHHAGSAGLFSTVPDLQMFLEHYLKDDFAKTLWQDYSTNGSERSLAWDLQGDWILHTGYTGTFIMANRQDKTAAIFLTNRTYEKDERVQWILDRNELIEVIKTALSKRS